MDLEPISLTLHGEGALADVAQEVNIQVCFLMYAHKHTPAQAKADSKSKPQSALNKVLTVRCKPAREHIVMLGSTDQLTRVFAALKRGYVERKGVRALHPARKRPISVSEVRGMLDGAASADLGASMGVVDFGAPLWRPISVSEVRGMLYGAASADLGASMGVVDFGAPLWATFCVIVCMCFAHGMRLGDSLARDAHPVARTSWTRDVVGWIRSGQQSQNAMDADAGVKLRSGDIAIMRTPSTKTNQTRGKFGADSLFARAEED
jgi:hypothetical protein